MEFWDSTPEETQNALDFAYKIREDKMKEDWARMRLQTVYLINVHLDEKNQIEDPQKLIRFPWEKEEITEYQEPDWEQLERDIKGIK